MALRKLSAADLITRCNPRKFADRKYESEPLAGFIGQENAYKAIFDGLTQMADGYNIVAIDPGTGLQSVLKSVIAEIAAKYPLSEARLDYCYVHNFDAPLSPILLVLPADTGQQFRSNMIDLYEALQAKIQEAFSHSDYLMNIQMLADDAETRIQRLWILLNKQMNDDHLVVSNEGQGPSLLHFERRRGSDYQQVKPAAQWVNDPTISDDEIAERRELVHNKWRPEVLATSKKVQEISIALQNEVNALTQKAVGAVLEECVTPLSSAYPQAAIFLERIKKFVSENLAFFSGQSHARIANHSEEDGEDESDEENQEVAGEANEIQIAFDVNVYVENDPDTRIPIVIEPSRMTYTNIFGELHRDSRLGIYYTDHSKLSAGAMANANGGVLFIDGNQLFSSPNCGEIWIALLHTLRTGTIELNELADEAGIILPRKLRPQPIPFEGKVVLLVDPGIYSILIDEFPADMRSLFRIPAWFSSTAPRTRENEYKYAQFVTLCQLNEGLPPFSPSAIARIIEYGARLAENKTKLSLNMSSIKTLVIEAGTVAQDAGAEQVTTRHVERAIAIQHERVSLMQSHELEYISDRKIIIRVHGQEVGRGNGLAVYEFADGEFGLPATITALRNRSSEFSISSIDADVGKTEKTFNKSCRTVASILANNYGTGDEIHFGITLSLEQVYDEIGGDSASTILICTALSALGNIPLRQDVAVTGSVNQLSETQAIGGVNYKVEGFFDACLALGKLAGQCVLIPESNIKDLMLRKDIVNACEQDRFHVYSYSTWHESMEFMTGLTMTEINQRVKAEIALQASADIDMAIEAEMVKEKRQKKASKNKKKTAKKAKADKNK